MPLRVDIHQHLWPEPLPGALSRWIEPPRLVRRGGGWTLHLSGEAPAPVTCATQLRPTEATA